jgi:hypothetical protein
MIATRLSRHARGRAGLGLVLLLLAWGGCPAPLAAQESPDWDRERVLPPNLEAAVPASGDAAPAWRSRRIRLFRIQPGFLSEPVGLDQDENLTAGADGPPAPLPDAGTGPDWIQVSMGSDNPYFDFRRSGDPGGVGFYRVNTQVQFFDSPSTGCSLGLQAVTPAGLQAAGIDTGPTVVSPAFSLFHVLEDGTAVQGFVGKNVPLKNAGTAPAPLRRNLEYGVALQRPLAATGPDPLRNLYFYVGALGETRFQKEGVRPVTWEVLPGLHWQVAENWWMSGGVLLPLGSSRAEYGLWQFTCSFQF